MADSMSSRIEAWYSGVCSTLGLPSVECIIQAKTVGYPIGLLYSNGILVWAKVSICGGLRDITEIALAFKNPQQLKDKSSILMSGSMVIHKKDIKGLSVDLNKDTLEILKDVILKGTEDSWGSIHVITNHMSGSFQKETDKIGTLKEFGFSTPDTFICNTVEEVSAVHNSMVLQKNRYSCEIDGTLIKINDLMLSEKFGGEGNDSCPLVVPFDS